MFRRGACPDVSSGLSSLGSGLTNLHRKFFSMGFSELNLSPSTGWAAQAWQFQVSTFYLLKTRNLNLNS
jgi:hypothetical protein